MAKQSLIDTDLIRDLANLLADTDLSEIEVEKADLRIRVARNVHVTAPVTYAAPTAIAAPAAAAPVASAPAAAAVPNLAGAVRSPMVGTAYLKANPDADVFIKVGSVVKAGDKIMLIEAMKTFNDILAPRAGTVTQILVDNATPVEFDEPLLVIE